MLKTTGLLGVLLPALVLEVLCEDPLLAEPGRDRCVVLVSVDGLANFYLDDVRSDMPTMRKLAREGARARGGAVCSFPTVTWPNHTTMATGATPARHGVIGNSYLDRVTGKSVSLLPDPLFDKDQIVKVPTVYDAAHQAGLKTAGIIWPASRSARTLDWTVPDMAGDEAWPRFGTKSWLAELRAEHLPIERHGAWVRLDSGGVQRDWLYVRMARQLLNKHDPNLILIHLVEPDHVQHQYGPRSPEAFWCMSYADDRIRDLVEAVANSRFAGKTTFVICGDHGFFPVRYSIQPNVVLRRLGFCDASGNKEKRPAAYCLSQGGASAVYVLDDSRRAEIIDRLKKAFGEIDGVESVLGPEEFTKLGQPTREQDPHAPDLWLAAKFNYAFGDEAGGDQVVVKHASVTGTHGFLPDQPDMVSACIISGPGVKPGTDLGKISLLDVAPTIAAILGFDLPHAEGRPIAAIAGQLK